MIRTSSDLLQLPSTIFGNLWKMLRKVQKMFGNFHLAFGTILKNLQKSSENCQKGPHQYAYMINKVIHGCLQKLNFSSPVQLDISLIRAYQLNTRRQILQSHTPIDYSLYTMWQSVFISSINQALFIAKCLPRYLLQ